MVYTNKVKRSLKIRFFIDYCVSSYCDKLFFSTNKKSCANGMTGTSMDAKLKNEMMKMAKAMKTLSGSNLAIYDVKIDIDSIKDDYHYLWALRESGTILVNLSIRSAGIDPSIATKQSSLFFFHIIGGSLLLVTREKALRLINQALR